MSRLEELIQELCPNGVEYKTIGEVCYISRGRVMSKDFIRDNVGEYPVYSSQTENNGELGKINTYMFDGEYITWTTDGANAGTVFYRTGKFSVTNVCGLLKLKEDNLLCKFLYYYLTTATEPYVNKGMGNAKLMSNVMAIIKVPIPPMEVQSEIVRILDNFTLLTAELTAELTARKEQYDCYRNKLIDEVVGRKGKLIELLVQPVTDGPHTTPVLFNEGVPFVSATSVYDGKVHLEDMKGYISKKYDEECSKKYKPKKFDVYMVKSGSTTGKVAIVDFEADFNIWSPLAALRTASATQAWYLYHLLQTQNVQEQVFSRMSHGSQPNLSMRVIEQFDVVIPSLEEQERIVNILNKFDLYCNDISKGLPAEIELRQQQYEYYRDKILTFKEL